MKGQAFDLAWEVAFHHSYDVLAHAALERALNGVEVPVYYKGEKIDTFRRFDERLTVALLNSVSLGGVPLMGKLGPAAEKHARDFESLLGAVEREEAVETGALRLDDPSEIAMVRRGSTADPHFPPRAACPSGMGDEDLMDAIQKFEDEDRS